MNETLVIINTANRPWTVIHTEELIKQWPNHRVHEFYFSYSGRPFDEADQNPLDAALEPCPSEANLLARLRREKPRITYVRVSPHTRSERLVTELRAALPDTRLIVEFYDLSLMLDESMLNYIFCGDEHLVELALAGCDVALSQADSVVVKMGGDLWEAWCRDVKVPVYTFFPLLGGAAGKRSGHGDSVRRVLFAGSLSARELQTGIGSVHGANFIRYFDAFLGQPNVRLDIINAVHNSISEDCSDKFALLLQRYDGESQSVRYERAVSRAEAVRRAAQYDLGICCAHYEADTVQSVTKMGVPNRMMTYVDAGLPFLIDDRFEYAAQLVREFDCGAVVPAGNIATFMELVRTLDVEKCRNGIADLRRFMIDQNRRVLAALQRDLLN